MESKKFPKTSYFYSSYTPISTVNLEEYTYEKGLKTQKEQITRIGNLFKNLAKKYDTIKIYPYKTFGDGLGISGGPVTHDSADKFMPPLIGYQKGTTSRGEAYFEIDGTDLSRFSDDFILFLGCLLVEKYTFVVKTGAMLDHEMLFAFSLLEGLLLPSKLKPSTNEAHIPVPVITSYVSDFYSQNYNDPALDNDNILRILENFYETNNIIGYPKATGAKKDRIAEFIAISRLISFIRDFF